MKKLNVLVCEDNETNAEAAIEQLEGHNVFVARSLTEVMSYLGNQAADDISAYAEKGEMLLRNDIDVVLTDMHMPGGCIPGLYEFGSETAGVGVFVALRAASVGIKHVGLMSDANHHCDAMTAGIDMVSGTWFTTERTLNVNGVAVVITTAKMVFDKARKAHVKDWRALLEGLMPDA